MFDIYSIGDSLFLEQVLNALAMIVGTGSFMVLVKIGFLFGILFIVLQAVADGGRTINFQHVLVGWLLFSLLFGASATVRINDVYTGRVRVVDNVPYGVAAIGSITSTVGYHTTELFEQAFSTPTMTSYGFSSSLQVLAKARQAFMDPGAYGVINTPNFFFGTGTDNILLSWRNYIKDCTLTGVDLDQKSLTSVMLWQLPPAGLKWDSGIYGTKIYVGGTIKEVTCTEAWDPLTKAIDNDTFRQGTERMLRAALASSDALFSGPGSSTAATDRLGDALTQLNLTTSSAKDYITNAVLLPALEDATVEKNMSEQAFTHAIMSRDAIERRNSEWAVSQSMFFNVIRPALTFIEAFSYAIAPFIGFLVGIGMMGISAAGKYGLTLIWIQLWMPLLAIINLYINMSASYKMAALGASTVMQLPSFGAMYQLDGILQTNIAFGGMLSALVPGISLMLVYGGTWASAGLVDRMSSTSQVDTTQATPKALSRGAVNTMASPNTFDQQNGMHRTGAPAIVPTISWKTGTQNTYGDSARVETGINKINKDGTTVSQGEQASTSHRMQLAEKTAASIGSELGLKSEQQQQLQGILGLGMSGASIGGGSGGKSGGISAPLKANIQSAFNDSTSNAILEKLANSKSTETGNTFAADYAEAYKKDHLTGTGAETRDGTTSGRSKTNTTSASSGITQNTNAIALAHYAAKPGSEQQMSQLQDTVKQLGLTSQAAFHARNAKEQHNLPQRTAQAFGAILALANARTDDGPRGQVANAAINALGSSYSGFNVDTTQPPTSAKNLPTDPHLNEIHPKELQNEAVALRKLAPKTINGTNVKDLADGNMVSLNGRSEEAMKQQHQEQAGRAFAALSKSIGVGPGFDGGGPGQDATKLLTEEAVGFYKNGAEALKRGVTATGRAMGAGAAGMMANIDKVTAMIQENYKNKTPMSPKVIGGLYAKAALSGFKEGGKDAIQDLREGIVSDSLKYAQAHGLKPEQAKLYAYEQSNIAARVLNGTNDTAGIMDSDRAGLRNHIENDNKDHVLAKAIEMAARTGSPHYLNQVGNINKLLDK